MRSRWNSISGINFTGIALQIQEHGRSNPTYWIMQVVPYFYKHFFMRTISRIVSYMREVRHRMVQVSIIASEKSSINGIEVFFDSC
jgi:hypothetical protein